MVHVVLWYRCGIFALSALRYFTVLPLFMRLSGHLLFPAMACVNSFFVPLRPVKRGTKQVKMVQLLKRPTSRAMTIKAVKLSLTLLFSVCCYGQERLPAPGTFLNTGKRSDV